MRICNLGDGLGQLTHAISDLNERWAETQEHWSDETSRDFEQTFLHPIPAQVQMLVAAVQRHELPEDEAPSHADSESSSSSSACDESSTVTMPSARLRMRRSSPTHTNHPTTLIAW